MTMPSWLSMRWEEAVKVNSKLGEAWNNLAVIYLRAGRKTGAEAAVKMLRRTASRFTLV